MKRILLMIVTSIMVFAVMGTNLAIAKETAMDEQCISMPTEGVYEEGNVGVGLYDHELSDIIPFAEYGIAQNNLKIQYDKSEDRILFSYYTRATDLSSEIGMVPLQLQMWNDSTQKWENISSGSPLEYNSYMSRSAYSYDSPIHNRYYRVSGYHYAKINGIDYKLYNETQYIRVP